MSRKRTSDGFNLAFLDVMACGLGAVLMILIVVKFNASTSIPSDEIQKLEEELAALNDEASQTQKSLDEVNDNIAMEIGTLEDIKKRIEELKVQQDATKRALNDKQAVVANLETAIAARAPLQTDDPIELKGSGEENYLLGLKVEGRKIGILIDSSASMMEENLNDILRLKNSEPGKKKAAAKWRRTVRVAKWLLARLPKESQVSVATFNSEARVLGERPVFSARVSASMKHLSAEIEKLVPNNGTDLREGIRAITQAMPGMTDLYIVTDGLPTLLKPNSGFKESRDCKPITQPKGMRTGECRMLVLAHTFSQDAPKKVKTNIVLLPLQGDHQAPVAYWSWARATGGIVLSPAKGWP